MIGSHVNHSCNPSLAIVPKHVYERWYNIDSSMASSGGVLLAYAIRALEPGESLTFNYGPRELAESWDVRRRRAFLQARQGFFCLCDKCVAEGGSEPPAAEVPVPATPAEKTAATGGHWRTAPPSAAEEVEEAEQVEEVAGETEVEEVGAEAEELVQTAAAEPVGGERMVAAMAIGAALVTLLAVVALRRYR